MKDVFWQGLILPKSKTAEGLAYSINQEGYLKDSGQMESFDRGFGFGTGAQKFTIDLKNGGTINIVRGAWASAVIYSVTETAGANGLNVYYYIKYLLEQLAALMDDQGNIEHSKLKLLMPGTKSLPVDCYSKRRSGAVLKFNGGH